MILDNTSYNTLDNTYNKYEHEILKRDIDGIFHKLSIEKPLQKYERYWIGISGSWRKTSIEIEHAVREAVREILSRNGGIVTGGALNVDFFATDEALKIDHYGIRVFLPVTLKRYAAHYRKRADEGVITHKQAETLISQLTKLKEANPDALIENLHNTEVNKDTYFERNTAVVNASDALIAFQVNESPGVEDTVVKTLEQGKPVLRFKYNI